jgi:membrane-bound lytic murein transglycosylase D
MISRFARSTAFLCLLLAGCSTLDTLPSQTGNAGASIDQIPPEAPAAGRTEREIAADDAEATLFWQQLRSGLQLDGSRHAEVQRELAHYRRNAGQVEVVFQRGAPYLGYIQGEVSKRGFPAEITLLPFVESSYDPFAYSHGRAAGLWQFIPETARIYGLQQDWWYDGRRDVVASTQAALDYLDRLQQQFDGDWLLALAAYNSGSGTVSRAIRRNRKAGKPADFWHLALPPETSDYVPKLLAISAVVAQPDTYGISLEPLPVQAMFEVVPTGGQLDLAVAAELAGLDTEELHRLNPGFNRWATHPDGPHRLAIPNDRVSEFRDNLAALPEAERIKWVRHKIQQGDTLSQIATHYDTTTAVLMRTNNLDGTGIRAGKHLLIPVAAKQPALANHLQPERTAANKLTYRVRNGDSLWSIAGRYKVSVRQVTRWNRLDSGALIRPGQQLVIWQSRKGGAEEIVRTVHYRVRSGDSLYRIAQKFSVSITDLRRWNKLSRGKYLQPGQHLKLYVDVTRQTHSNQG